MPEIRIANCSGFFGDRPSGAREMVEGGPIDVLTGDWLAELTMLILSRIRAKRPGSGYARTFVTQMEEVMGTCLDRGIKVVSNAGGLDPDGCAEAVAEVAAKLGLNPTIAFVDGDDLLPRMDELAGHLQPFDHRTSLGDLNDYVTANAYLGCWGIVEALRAGADIVVTGRVTDAAVTCGPAAWFHGWTPDDLDQLAGAVVAGHVIECSAQATGGNYSFFSELTNPNPRLGFPWAEIAADGTSVIGKHDNTGGEVTIGTVTSQLLYEIGDPEYLGPDVTARFDTIELQQQAPDRVRISGVKGSPPPETLKVAMNQMAGYRNSFAVALTGLDIEAKAAFAGGILGVFTLGARRLFLNHVNGCSYGQAGPPIAGGGHRMVAFDGEGPGSEQGWPSLQRCCDPHRARQYSRHVLSGRWPNWCQTLRRLLSQPDPRGSGDPVRTYPGRVLVGGAGRPTGGSDRPDDGTRTFRRPTARRLWPHRASSLWCTSGYPVWRQGWECQPRDLRPIGVTVGMAGRFSVRRAAPVAPARDVTARDRTSSLSQSLVAELLDLRPPGGRSSGLHPA